MGQVQSSDMTPDAWLPPANNTCTCGHAAFEHGGAAPHPCILTGNGECDCEAFTPTLDDGWPR